MRSPGRRSAVVDLDEHRLMIGCTRVGIHLDALRTREQVLAQEHKIAAIRMLAVLRARQAKRRGMRMMAVKMGPHVAIARPAAREGLLNFIVRGILRRKGEVAGE